MTSEAQITANRLNALKSTGPRTPTGKAVIALNGTKHGLLSRKSLIKGEREADLVNFETRLRTQLAPVGELEMLLVDRIVSNSWRLRRLVSVEAMLFDKEDSPDGAFDNYGREKMGVLSRYEVTLERSLYRALHELQRLQAARSGQPVPLPEVVDVEVSVSDRNCEMALVGENRLEHARARFSNRPIGVKRFQTIHHCSVDVAHGLVLLFGIGTKALPSWDSKTRWNNL